MRCQPFGASGLPCGARKDLKPAASLIVVSMRSTLPCLSYILIELSPRRCLMRTPSGRVFMSLTTSAFSLDGKRPEGGMSRPRKRITSGLKNVVRPCRTSLGYSRARAAASWNMMSLAHSLWYVDQ